MVVYHALFDWNFFIQPIVDLQSGFWFWFARTGSLLFVVGAGTVTYLVVKRKTNGQDIFMSLLRRGILLIGFGALITIASFIFFSSYTIWFGILHFIGVSTILSISFIRRPRFALIIGILVALIGVILSTQSGMLPSITGILPYSFQTFDYFPLFPWFGFFLLGLYIGQQFLRSNPGKWNQILTIQPLTKKIIQLGQQSFTIYFIHQPILIGIILFIKEFLI